MSILSTSSPVIEALLSPGPNPEHVEKLMQFGRLVGSWDLDVIYYDSFGEIKLQIAGEWHFGWALEGRAIVDVWMVPPRSQRHSDSVAPGEYGVTLRFYDSSIDAWRSTWHGPVNGIVWPFIARQIGEEMVLERIHDDGGLTRWIFGKISPDFFHWRAVSSNDDGETWRLEQEMFAKRCR